MTKISELPVADALTGAELVPVVQGGVTKQVAASAVAVDQVARDAAAAAQAAANGICIGVATIRRTANTFFEQGLNNHLFRNCVLVDVRGSVGILDASTGLLTAPAGAAFVKISIAQRMSGHTASAFSRLFLNGVERSIVAFSPASEGVSIIFSASGAISEGQQVGIFILSRQSGGYVIEYNVLTEHIATVEFFK